MKITFNYFLVALFLFAFSSCLNIDPVEPITIIEPPTNLLVGSDTISTGSYWGLSIGKSAESTYTTVKTLKDSKGQGITFLNVVSSIFTDVTMLEERLPLYQSIFFDEAKGTDSGVQITFEDNKVKSIFLNNGNKLNRWPVSLSSSSAIVRGDMVGTVYGKLVSISRINAFKSKFERMSLFTKDVCKDYDPHMALSPQWYFSTEIEQDKKMDVVQLNLKDGVLHSIIVNHYQTYL